MTNPQLRILVNGGGSGVGINQVGEGHAHIGMSSRDITEEEKQKYPGLIEHVIGKDAVAAAISSEVYEEGITALTLEQIKKIYSGEVQNWKELGGPDREILVIDKEPSRGTRHVFMSVVFGDKNAKAEGADIILGSNNEEQTAIAQSDAAIGMLSLAWLNDEVKGVTLSVDTENIEPTRENVIAGNYPISRDLLLLTLSNPSEEVQKFISYLKTKGQQAVEESGYVSIN